jgi:hypothetical protein
MGIASRTKWEWRIKSPTVTRHGQPSRPRVLDAAKLAHRTDLRHAQGIAASTARGRYIGRSVQQSVALEALTARRKRRAKAASRRGWLPAGQR